MNTHITHDPTDNCNVYTVADEFAKVTVYHSLNENDFSARIDWLKTGPNDYEVITRPSFEELRMHIEGVTEITLPFDIQSSDPYASKKRFFTRRSDLKMFILDIVKDIVEADRYESVTNKNISDHIDLKMYGKNMPDSIREML